MANNIYIGNRYVPVFANPVEWDNLREYEPLTIVTYNGTAYTSRQTVPVGTALSNTEYWVVTGNYNAQVEQYRQEVVGVQSDLDDLSDSVDTNFTNVNKSIDLLNLGTVVCIGDSYLAGWTPDGDVVSWGHRLCEYLGKTLNTNFFEYWQGGAGFNATNDGKNFGTLLTEAYNAITDRNSVGAIIAVGGANEPDSGNTSGAIETFVSNARNYFPNATVYYAYGSTFVESTPYNVIGIQQRYERAITGAVYMGNIAKFLTGYKDILYNADERHPNTNGQKMLAKLIYGCLNGAGVPTINRPSRAVSTNIIEYIAQDTWRCYAYGNVHANVSLSGHFSNGSTLLYSITKNNSYRSKADNNFYQYTANGFIHADNKYRLCQFRVIDKPTAIEIYDLCMTDAGNTYLTSDVDYFELSPFDLSLPVELI